jgi:structural protein KPP10_ORF10
MNVYSFLNISCLIAGPGIVANLAAGAAAADEGITIEPGSDKNEMTIGADGKGQHSLIADDSAHITIHLLKTSPMNALLMIAYDLQTSSSALHGQNIITVADSARGDLHVLRQVAFKKKPPIDYKKAGGMISWEFDVINANSVLGL